MVLHAFFHFLHSKDGYAENGNVQKTRKTILHFDVSPQRTEAIYNVCRILSSIERGKIESEAKTFDLRAIVLQCFVN